MKISLDLPDGSRLTVEREPMQESRFKMVLTAAVSVVYGAVAVCLSRSMGTQAILPLAPVSLVFAGTIGGILI